MPYRSYSREQDWLLPPTLAELLADDHPARFVAEFVDQLELASIGIAAESAAEGAPSYHPKLLLSAWLYGFMVRVRSSRKLERACTENVAFMWLTGMQRPDHVTLWRFYRDNRQALRRLLKQTVRLAMEVGLVDFALQAVDGSRVSVSSLDSLKGRAALAELLAQVEAEISAMEHSDQPADGPADRTPRSPQALPSKREMGERLRRALAKLDELEGVDPGRPEQPGVTGAVAADAAGAGAASAAEPEGQSRPGQGRISATDPEAVWIKRRGELSLGYNGQVVVDSQAQIIVAADVVASSSDTNQLLPMLQEAEAMTGRPAAAVTADVGYFAMPDLDGVQRLGTQPYVPDRRAQRADAPDLNPYHKDHFVHDPTTDTYRCPLGQTLRPHGTQRQGDRIQRMYRGEACQGCPAQQSGACTKSTARRIRIYGHEQALALHADKMKTDAARAVMARRKTIVEPVFAVFREQLGLLRFLVRGLEKVKAEWRLLCIAHNLRKLWKYWWRPKIQQELANF